MYCAAVRRSAETFSSRPNIRLSGVRLSDSGVIGTRSETDTDAIFLSGINLILNRTAPEGLLRSDEGHRVRRHSVPDPARSPKPRAGSLAHVLCLNLSSSEKQHHPQNRIHQASQDAEVQLQRLGHADQAAGHGEINRGMNQIKAQRHQKAGPGVFHVELHAQRRCPVTHDRLGDSIDSDGIVSRACPAPGR